MTAEEFTEEYPGQSEDIAHDRFVNVTLDRLADDLKEATASGYSAERHLRQLTAGDAWYIELAETAEGEDAAAELANAMLSLRNVERIVKRHVALFAETPAEAPAAKGADE